MYLKQLEIQGFKSFAEKVEIDFTKGITAIVGPNGSGKSNVVDAIRWVLGEQSAKNLRGSRMDDIIFSGSSKKRATGMASISLTINNTRGLLPLDFNEITVTRRLYRSGESEYLINKVPCRLKDIYELFMDTGVGKEGFSIIGQGKIDEILSLKPEDRRNLIEESAGIVKYRYRKTEAKRKLSDTEQSLLRVNDIIFELEEQLGPLEEQAQKAAKYNEWKKELDDWQISLLVDEVEKNKKIEIDLKDKLRMLEHKLTESDTEYHKLESEITSQRLDIQKKEQLLADLQQKYFDANSELEKNAHHVDMAKERKSNLNEQIIRLEKEITSLLENEKSLRDDILKNQTELNLVNDNYKNSTIKIATLLDELSLKKQDLEENSSLLEKHKNKIFNVLQENAKIDNEISRINNEIEFKNSQSLEITNKITEVKEQISLLKENLAKTRTQKENLTKQKKELEDNLKGIEEELETKLYTEKKLKEKYDLAQIEFTKTKSRLQVIKEMEEAKEGYQFGVRSVLDKNFKGIIGTVADIITVPKNLELAIETALGGSLQNIITENDRSAQDAIEYLKKEKKGRATFLPLNTVKGKRQEVSFDDPDVLGRAIDLVQFDPKFEGVMEFLLGRILIISNLSKAVSIGKRKSLPFRMVTLEGDLVAPSGALTGGSYKKQKSGLLGRKRLVNELTEKIISFKEDLTSIKEKIDMCDKEKNQSIERISSLKSDLEKTFFLLHEKNNLEVNILKELKLLVSEEENKKIEKEKLITEINNLKDKQKSLVEKLQKLTLDNQDNDKKTEELKDLIEELKKLESIWTDKVNEEKINNATLRQTKMLTENRQKDLEVAVVNLKNNLEKIENEKINLSERIAEIDKQIENEKINKNKLISVLEEYNINLENLKNEKDTISEDVILRENNAKKLKKNIDIIHKEKYQNEMKITKIDLSLRSSQSKLLENHQISYEEALRNKKTIDDLSSILNRIEELEASIKDLGLVNFTAINEFERVKERLEFLKVQYGDLTDAKESLNKVINEMDGIMVKKFKEAFESINEAFMKVFSELFEGGKAYLELTDEKDLLNTGIEIIAKPPGKKPQTLSLLSGGERAMTAIALLLGILKVKPSPFCVLDEIDSALDEANVNRFAKYVKDFSGKTQFIIVSHRKGTMEVGDVLYGVTIEDSGSSKLISVKLSDFKEAK